MILGLTGTRKGMTRLQRSVVKAYLANERPSLVHHGCAEGADRDFFLLSHFAPQRMWPSNDLQWAWAQRVKREQDEVNSVFEPLRRNRFIVDHIHALLAIPRTQKEEQRSGTWMTVRYARKVGRPLMIIWPDGSTKTENA